MSRLILVVLTIILGITLAPAQFEKGNVELSLSGTGGGLGTTNTSEMMPPATMSGIYVFLNTSIGYYFLDGLSIEPQYGLLAEENLPPAHSLILNLSYNKRIPNSNIALFVEGGYGISNSISFPLFNGVYKFTFDKWIAHIINAGTGVKYLVKNDIALKVELNYRSESFTYTDPYHNMFPAIPTNSTNVTYSYFGVLFGFSIIL